MLRSIYSNDPKVNNEWLVHTTTIRQENNIEVGAGGPKGISKSEYAGVIMHALNSLVTK